MGLRYERNRHLGVLLQPQALRFKVKQAYRVEASALSVKPFDNIVEETVTVARRGHRKMQRVFVLDTDRNPLMPCHPARARALLKSGRASVYRRFPFTIIMHDRTLEKSEVQDVQIKIDPGSKTTGIALVANSKVVWGAEITHRGQAIRQKLADRRAARRGRRNRKTRYRPARFDNRTKPKGWLPPSLRSRIDNVMVWVTRLSGYAPVASISMELVRFDTQIMQNGKISGVEYQQGELAGYEVREYLLEKWGRKCAYCGAKDVPMEVEHIVPRSRGGSNRISNLTLACNACNQAKGSQTAFEYGYPQVQAQAKQPLRDAATVNASRWALWRKLSEIGLPLETGTGGRTKYNRVRQGYPKAHWIDAACVGVSGETVCIDPRINALSIKAVGRGRRQMCLMDRYGFPRTKPKAVKRVRGFQTGDMVKAVLSDGKKAGVYVGRVAVRAIGSFCITGQADGISWKHCRLLHHADGYEYSTLSAPGGAGSYPSPRLKAGVSRSIRP